MKQSGSRRRCKRLHPLHSACWRCRLERSSVKSVTRYVKCEFCFKIFIHRTLRPRFYLIPFYILSVSLLDSYDHYWMYKSTLTLLINSRNTTFRRLIFDRGHPFVHTLTSNILNYSSNTTQVYLHRMLKLGY